MMIHLWDNVTWDISRQTREGDKDAILTKVMKRCPPGHRIMSDEDRSLYALNKSTNQILYHKKVSGLSKIKIPTVSLVHIPLLSSDRVARNQCFIGNHTYVNI